MTDFAVRADALSKEYVLGQYRSGFGMLRSLGRETARETTWALRDVSFEVREGEAVAIIGHNGAGKSTLLKVLSRITTPTSGYADVRGRVGSLLEVGTGFHPELTGRENVYLNGTILGMRRSEIAGKFDEIVEFSGVAQFIDTPVKRYSTGMYIRLAFAVAAFLEPEILIVDEVLAVGDAEFQKRCLGRMSEVAHGGRTVLFVSHNMQAVRRLCERAILLDHGSLTRDGSVEEVVRGYLASLDSPEEGRRRWDDPDARPGTDLCRIAEVRVTDELGHTGTTFLSSQPIVVTLEFDLARVDPSFSAAFDLVSVDGSTVFRSAQTDVADAARPRLVAGRNALSCTIPPGLLNSGRYAVNLRFALHMTNYLATEDGVLAFDVVADHGESLFLNAPSRPGVVAPILRWDAVEPAADGVDELDQPLRASL